MSVTVADVRAVPNEQPGFAGFSDSYIADSIDTATRYYADMVGSTDYDKLVKLTVAHYLRLEEIEGGGGGGNVPAPVQSASAGGVSMTLAAIEAMSADDWRRTPFGRQVKRLLRINGPYSRVGTTAGKWR